MALTGRDARLIGEERVFLAFADQDHEDGDGGASEEDDTRHAHQLIAAFATLRRGASLGVRDQLHETHAPAKHVD